MDTKDGNPEERVETLSVRLSSVVILIAGSWPFHAPKNEVGWISNGNGLRFGKHGVTASPDTFGLAGSKPGISCSLEIWVNQITLIKGVLYSHFIRRTIVSSDSRLHQSIGDLLLRRKAAYGGRAKATMYIEGLFRKSKPLFLTITASAQGTVVYLNGALVRTSPQFGLDT